MTKMRLESKDFTQETMLPAKNLACEKPRGISYKQRTIVLSIVLAPIAYFSSYYLLSLYLDGDQRHYHELYDTLYGASIYDILNIAFQYVTSSEPISAFILWLGSNLGIEKNIYISILNVFFILGIFILARIYRVSWPMLLLLLTNFYVIVLMTSAERLKISFIFIILSAIFSGKLRLIFAGLSPFAHLQSIILLSVIILVHFERPIRQFFLDLKLNTKALAFSLFLLVAFAVFSPLLIEGALYKWDIYTSKDYPLTGLVNVLILSIMALYVTKNRFRMLLVLLVSIIGVAVLGGERINMIAIVLVIYYLMIENRLHHPIIYFLMIYLSLKTIPFVNKIILYGNGFA